DRGTQCLLGIWNDGTVQVVELKPHRACHEENEQHDKRGGDDRLERPPRRSRVRDEALANESRVFRESVLSGPEDQGQPTAMFGHFDFPCLPRGEAPTAPTRSRWATPRGRPSRPTRRSGARQITGT